MRWTLRLIAAAALMASFAGTASAQTPEATPTITTSPYIAGDAFASIPEGDPDTISVVLSGITEAERGTVGLVVRNNTNADAVAVRVVATARENGDLFAVSETVYVTPTWIVAGGVGIGVATFEGTALTDDLTFEFDVSEDEYGDSFAESFPSLSIESANRIDDRIVGEATNESPNSASFGSIRGLCFTDGVPSSDLFDTISDSEVTSGETVPFQVNLREPCTTFLLTVG